MSFFAPEAAPKIFLFLFFGADPIQFFISNSFPANGRLKRLSTFEKGREREREWERERERERERD